jgi:hypothetical protein
MSFASVESLVYDDVEYQVIDQLHYPGRENVYIWLLLRSADGVELILEEFGGLYTLLVPADDIVAFEPVHVYTLAFRSITGRPSWLAQNLVCAHGSSGEVAKIADRMYLAQPVSVGTFGVLNPELRETNLRPVVNDPLSLAELFLRGVSAASGPLVEVSPAEVGVASASPGSVRVQDRRELGGRRQLLLALSNGPRWVDDFDVVRVIMDRGTRHFLIDETGAPETFHVLLRRDGGWVLESYPDAEFDPDVAVLLEE